MKVRLNEPTFGEEEIEAAVAVMRSTMVTQGDKVREFEAAFATKFGFERAVACNSGSSANLLAVAALCAREHLSPGDEVVVPALAWSTTVSPLLQYGLVPVFVDCDPETLNMRFDQSLNGKPVMPIHTYGNPYRHEYVGWRIEDCCEALGAHHENPAVEYKTEHYGAQAWTPETTPASTVPVGRSGHLSTFSFYFSHHITTFEGGMVAMTDKTLLNTLRMLRSHGWPRDCEDKEQYALQYPDIDPKFLFIEAGYNLRMTEMQAAVGLVQLPKLNEIVWQRRLNHEMYIEALSAYDFFRFQKMAPGSSCFSFAIILKDAPFSRAAFIAALTEAGIENRPIIAGNMARQPVMQKYKHRIAHDLDNATYVMKNGIAIGNHQDVGPDEIGYVADTIRDFVRLNA